MLHCVALWQTRAICTNIMWGSYWQPQNCPGHTRSFLFFVPQLFILIFLVTQCRVSKLRGRRPDMYKTRSFTRTDLKYPTSSVSFVFRIALQSFSLDDVSFSMPHAGLYRALWKCFCPISKDYHEQSTSRIYTHIKDVRSWDCVTYARWTGKRLWNYLM